MTIMLKNIFATAIICSLTACVSSTQPNYHFNKGQKRASTYTEDLNKASSTNLDYANEEDFDNARRYWIDRDEDLVICLSNEPCELTDPTNPREIWNVQDYQKFISPEDTSKSSKTNNFYQSYPDKYTSTNQDSPSEVNQSLWRNAKLSMFYGLFAVHNPSGDAKLETGDIFQVRGYDLSNITFVRGDSGWIVFDPLISPETVKSAFDLLIRNLPSVDDSKNAVSAVVYSHTHTDHYGGINGLSIPLDHLGRSTIEIYAPDEFTEHAVSESVIAGNAMGRRAVYMYGSMLGKSETGSVNAGLGMTTSTGVPGLIVPTQLITKETEFYHADNAEDEITPGVSRKEHCQDPNANALDAKCSWDIDGVKMQFQMTPGTEAPAEMNTWFVDSKVLWMAENTTNTMHNILTLRGAKVRDALEWAKYLNNTIDRYADHATAKFQSHHWPVWNYDSTNTPTSTNKVKDYLLKQRDVYKYMHDQTVRLLNQGYNGEEVSEAIKLPTDLEKNWATRGYYGTLKHNTRAIYQYYMGWYNGNPSQLDNLPPLESAINYLDAMGGVTNALNNGTTAVSSGNYRWAAQILKHVVFAQSTCDPSFYVSTAIEDLLKNVNISDLCTVDNTEAKLALADAYEQLGYQAESGPWRSIYLQGASELRTGTPPDTTPALEPSSPDIIKNMPVDMLFDYWGVRLLPEKAKGKNLGYVFQFADVMKGSDLCNDGGPRAQSSCAYYLTVNNSVLNYTTVMPTDWSDSDNNTIPILYLKKSTIDAFAAGKVEALTSSNDMLEVLACDDSEGCVYIQNNGAMTPQDIKDQLEGLLDVYKFWFNIVTPNPSIKLVP